MPTNYFVTSPWNDWAISSSTATSWTNNTWANWSGSTAATTGSYMVTAPTPERLTPEQRAEQELRVARHEAARKVEQRRRELASERAEQLLKTILTEDQWVSWERDKNFELITQSGRRYRIRRGVSHNVQLVEDDFETESLCAHPAISVWSEDGGLLGKIPAEDVVVAQVLALRTDEEGFRRVANISQWYRENLAA